MSRDSKEQIGRAAVRVGDTVRRPCGLWCPAVHALLRHLKAKGQGVPEVLGVDAQGREILGWVEGDAGETAGKVRPESQSDAVLVRMARLIRSMHEASTDFDGASLEWEPLLRDVSGSSEVICHNDISFSNTIFRGEVPIALIDWELAAPGSRLWDIAYAVWWLVPLHRPEAAAAMGWRPSDQPRRLRLFCDSYGLDKSRSGLLDVLHERQLANQRQLRKWVDENVIPRFDGDDPSLEVGRTDYVDGRRRGFEKALLD